MKKWILWLAAFGIMTACSKTENEKPETDSPEVTISVPDVSLSDTGLENKSFIITSDTPWSIALSDTRALPSWFTVVPLRGDAGTVTVNVTAKEENSAYDDRSAYIKITAGKTVKVLTVTQKKKDAIILTRDQMEVSPAGGTFRVELKTNVTYSIEIPSGSSGWISRESKAAVKGLENKTEYFSVREGDTENPREGMIVFRSSDLKDTVRVYQARRDILILSRREYTISNDAVQIEVSLRSNIEYDVTIPAGAAAWVRQGRTKAERVDRCIFEISENETYDPRSAKIIFKDRCSELSDTLTILQASKESLILSARRIEVPREGKTIGVELKTNLGFRVEIPQEYRGWIVPVETKGLASYNLQFNIAAHNGQGAREGKIIVSSITSGLSDTVRIVQGGAAYNYGGGFIRPGDANEGDGIQIKSVLMLDNYLVVSYGNPLAYKRDGSEYTCIYTEEGVHVMLFGSGDNLYACKIDSRTNRLGETILHIVKNGNGTFSVQYIAFNWESGIPTLIKTETITGIGGITAAPADGTYISVVKNILNDCLFGDCMAVLGQLPFFNPLDGRFAELIRQLELALARGMPLDIFTAPDAGISWNGAEYITDGTLRIDGRPFPLIRCQAKAGAGTHFIYGPLQVPEKFLQALWDSQEQSGSVLRGNGRVFGGKNPAALFNHIIREVRLVTGIQTIFSTSAVCTGKIENGEDLQILRKGMCWARHSLPAITDNVATRGEGSVTVSYHLPDLLQDTKYYARFFVETPEGLLYGNTVAVKTPEPVFVFTPSEPVFEADGGTRSISVQSELEWKIVDSPRWCHCTKDIASFKLDVEKYDKADDRIGYILLECSIPDTPERVVKGSVKVRQKGKRPVEADGFFGGTRLNGTSWHVQYDKTITTKSSTRVAKPHFSGNNLYYTYHVENKTNTEKENINGYMKFSGNKYITTMYDAEEGWVSVFVSIEGENIYVGLEGTPYKQFLCKNGVPYTSDVNAISTTTISIPDENTVEIEIKTVINESSSHWEGETKTIIKYISADRLLFNEDSKDVLNWKNTGAPDYVGPIQSTTTSNVSVYGVPGSYTSGNTGIKSAGTIMSGRLWGGMLRKKAGKR